MTDVYKLIANMICNSINGKWDKAIVEIESSLGRMLSTNAYYFYNNEEKHAFELIEDNQSEDLGEFDMTFEWDQALQDEWDNA